MYKKISKIIIYKVFFFFIFNSSYILYLKLKDFLYISSVMEKPQKLLKNNTLTLSYLICLHNLIVLSNTMHRSIINASNAFECLFRPTWYSFSCVLLFIIKREKKYNSIDEPPLFLLIILIRIPNFHCTYCD